ncbi:GIY-YIG nuclease family protein [Candidatus Saccharibacteria bacterium CPR2]|nr:GIY-YIG nuclease family protein [Candidatus Saccharibacteria bacterium CPR2]
MNAFVYILYFPKSDKYYIGSTIDLARRIKQHRSGYTPSTVRLGDECILKFSQEFSSIKIARKLENKLKSWKRKDFIEKIIKDGYIKSVDT